MDHPGLEFGKEQDGSDEHNVCRQERNLCNKEWKRHGGGVDGQHEHR